VSVQDCLVPGARFQAQGRPHVYTPRVRHLLERPVTPCGVAMYEALPRVALVHARQPPLGVGSFETERQLLDTNARSFGFVPPRLANLVDPSLRLPRSS